MAKLLWNECLEIQQSKHVVHHEESCGVTREYTTRISDWKTVFFAGGFGLLGAISGFSVRVPTALGLGLDRVWGTILSSPVATWSCECYGLLNLVLCSHARGMILRSIDNGITLFLAIIIIYSVCACVISELIDIYCTVLILYRTLNNAKRIWTYLCDWWSSHWCEQE